MQQQHQLHPSRQSHQSRRSHLSMQTVHANSALYRVELETNHREVFTITEKGPSVAY